MIDLPNSAGIRPLVLALYCKDFESVEHLLNLGAEPNIRDTKSPCHTPLEHTVFLEKLDFFHLLVR